MLDVLDDQEWKTEAEIVAELGALPKFKSPGRRTLLPFSVQANLRSMTHLGLLETQPRRQKREEEVPEYRLSGQGGEWRRRRKERAEKVERKAFHPPSMVPRPA
jgi:hypothetical protein